MINGTGVDYPTIELGGKTYTVKFSRGMLYRMHKQGVVFAPQVKFQEAVEQHEYKQYEPAP